MAELETTERPVEPKGLAVRFMLLLWPCWVLAKLWLWPGGLLPGVLLVRADSMGSVRSRALKPFASPGVSAAAP